MVQALLFLLFPLEYLEYLVFLANLEYPVTLANLEYLSTVLLVHSRHPINNGNGKTNQHPCFVLYANLKHRQQKIQKLVWSVTKRMFGLHLSYHLEHW